jgi:putative FmdB family regulatory protein
MPLYEYECEACGHRFEVIQKFSDPPVEQCPKCGGPVHKLQSAPAFQFKGTGWYITDYARKEQAGAKSDGKETATGGKEGAASAEKGDQAKTEKPAPEKSGKTEKTEKPSSTASAASGSSKDT